MGLFYQLGSQKVLLVHVSAVLLLRVLHFFYFFIWLILVISFLFLQWWWWWGRWSDTNTALGLTCLRVALAEEPGQHDPVQHALPPLQVVLDRVREENGVDEAAGDHLDRPQCDQDPRESHRLERTLVGV